MIPFSLKRTMARIISLGLLACTLISLAPAAKAAEDGYKVRQMGQVTAYISALVKGSDGFNLLFGLNGYVPKTVSMTMTGDFTPQQQLEQLEGIRYDFSGLLPLLPLELHAITPADAQVESMYDVLNHFSYDHNTYASSITPGEAVYTIIPPGDQPLEGLSLHGACQSFWPAGGDTWKTTTRCLYLDGQAVAEWTTKDGRIVSYQIFSPDFQTEVEDTAPVSVTPTTSKMFVDGQEVSLGAYLIDDTTYVRLRDIAYLLSGTPAQFDIAWHGETGQIELLPGQGYTPTGVELGALPPATAFPSASILTRMYEPFSSNWDFTSAEFLPTAYNIGGSNFYRLRDIAHIADFTVRWDEATKSVHITSEKNNYWNLV